MSKDLKDELIGRIPVGMFINSLVRSLNDDGPKGWEDSAHELALTLATILEDAVCDDERIKTLAALSLAHAALKTNIDDVKKTVVKKNADTTDRGLDS